MMPACKWPISLVTCVLVSCGTTPSERTNGAFRTPDADGRIATDLVETQSATIDATIGIVAGRREGEGLRAFAGIIPDQPPQPPLTGEATFRGPYTVAFIEDIAVEDDFVTGRNSLIEGTITLRTDLSENTIFGTDEIFTVRAQITDSTTLSGDVTVLGVPGVLEGEIGDNRAFGAFHGGDPTHLMSGGFVATRTP